MQASCRTDSSSNTQTKILSPGACLGKRSLIYDRLPVSAMISVSVVSPLWSDDGDACLVAEGSSGVNDAATFPCS